MMLMCVLGLHVATSFPQLAESLSCELEDQLAGSNESSNFYVMSRNPRLNEIRSPLVKQVLLGVNQSYCGMSAEGSPIVREMSVYRSGVGYKSFLDYSTSWFLDGMEAIRTDDALILVSRRKEINPPFTSIFTKHRVISPPPKFISRFADGRLVTMIRGNNRINLIGNGYSTETIDQQIEIVVPSKDRGTWLLEGLQAGTEQKVWTVWKQMREGLQSHERVADVRIVETNVKTNESRVVYLKEVYVNSVNEIEPDPVLSICVIRNGQYIGLKINREIFILKVTQLSSLP
jgi:hypothetical protein